MSHWMITIRAIHPSAPSSGAKELGHLLFISVTGPTGVIHWASPFRPIHEAPSFLSPWIQCTRLHLVHQAPFRFRIPEPGGEHRRGGLERRLPDQDLGPCRDDHLTEEGYRLLEVLPDRPAIVQELPGPLDPL